MIALPPEVVATMAASGLSVEVFDRLRRRLTEGGWRADENRLRCVVEAPAVGDIGGLPTDTAALRARGEQALRAGQVGIVLLNGGMATRFGERVKGVVEVSEGRSFLGLKVLDARRAAQRVGGPPVPVLLMNSRATTEATAHHLSARDHFGHPASSIWSFEQQWAVRLQPSGALFRDDEGRPSYYGPGHGDLPDCVQRSGLLERFEAAGGRYLLMSNVDNAAATLDPVLLGWHIEGGGALTVEVVDKHPGDVGGAPWRVDGRAQIVETFRLPAGVDPDASPVFNTNTLWFSAEALRGPAPLTWLMVRKQAGGRPTVQFERLIGELSASVDTRFVRVPRVGRATRFVPVKTPEDLAANRAWLTEAWGAR